MKGLLGACLLASLQSMTAAQAYESDIHYSTTYVLARAAGWSEAEALTIASANQGVDENKDTVAALEVDSTSNHASAGYVAGSLHQAEKNLNLHCFSSTGGEAGAVSADVLEVISARFAEVPGRDQDPRRNARSLIALGTALHCQQDANSHVGFGGSCGSYAGSCYGHTYETFFDQVVFGLLKKHYFNPDHPGVSGPWLMKALQGTASALWARLPKTSLHQIPHRELVALYQDLRKSGLELPDEVRRDCNRYVAGKWLYDFFQSTGSTQVGPGALETLAPESAVSCQNASLASATVVRIPDPRFPRLNPDASPRLVRADGTYEQLRDGDDNVSLPAIAAQGTATRAPNYNTQQVRVQLSHWRQLLALPLVMRVARSPRDTSAR